MVRAPVERMACPISAAPAMVARVLTSCIGSLAAGSARLTRGITAMASASLVTPRTPGIFSLARPPRSGLRPEADFDLPVRRAHGGGPVGGAVHQQAVAQRHAAEAQLVGRALGVADDGWYLRCVAHARVVSMSSE